ncbi:hypothetical protein [Acinetobacter sp.]|uniref:hypothetical protein n=1 Tax=Acinetobacter sp. TaxID=472 RepID=UPI003D082C6D
MEKDKRSFVHRLGRFSIPGSMVYTNPDLIMKILSRVVVTRAEYLLHDNRIEYIGYSWDFAEKEEYAEAPTYTAVIDDDSGDLRFDPAPY